MSRLLIFSLLIVTVLSAAAPADALKRYRHRSNDPFFARTVLTGYAGFGIPVGDFSSNRDGDGNHESGAFDWNFTAEHYFGRNVSLGALLSGSTWQDKTVSDLETDVSTFGGFLRYVVPVEGPIYPFLSGGVTSTRLQFVDSFDRLRADRSGGFFLGGGLIGMVTSNIGVLGSATYNHSSTYDAYVRELDNTIVGFDTNYWSFGAGLSIFLP